MKLSVTHYSGDRLGGAARAALRLHAAFRQHPIIDSSMIVAEKTNDDYTIRGLDARMRDRFGAIIKSAVDAVPRRLATPRDSMPRSAGWATRLAAKDVNSHPSDIAHLHWINGTFLSVEEIGRITKPLVWTLHDMWPFCGAEHLAGDEVNARWRIGYNKMNRNPLDTGLDIDSWVWRRKKNAWRNPIHIVTPSRWLAECVRSSALMRDWDVTVIPNALDMARYKPIQKNIAREILGLPSRAKLILFGAIRGTQLSYKGWDLLKPALAKLVNRLPDAHAVIFGQGAPENPPSLGMTVHWMGHLHDDAALALLYSAADVTVVPSRQEAFGQTASEAQACGCPVVAFNATGLRDIVDHGQTGYLATPYSSDDLARGIEWTLADSERHENLSSQARERAAALWSTDIVASKYVEVYRRAICTTGH